MARLLVSVRSAAEARAALAGGASIIDVKEPSRGPLGRADASVWQAVRSAVPNTTPVSVALGELNEWGQPELYANSEIAWEGIAFCKLGLADAPADWLNRWRDLETSLRQRFSATPRWVAVVYLDWQAAKAPRAEAVIEAVVDMHECAGVLFDTWSKSSGALLDRSWKSRVESVRHSKKFVALAGSIDVAVIARLHAWHPDVFAVRGAACIGGNRLGQIDTGRVARLAEAVRGDDESGRSGIPGLLKCRTARPEPAVDPARS